MAKGESECSMEKKTPPDEEREVISCSRNPISFFLAFRRLRILTVEPTMFFYMFGMYVFIFFHTQYIYNMFGREQFRDVLNFTGRFNFCITGHTAKEQLDPVVNGSSHYIKAQTSYLSIYVNVAGQLPGIVAALFFGTASDRIGRKPFLVAMGVCSTLAATLLLVFVHYELTPYTLIVVSSVYAIGGGMPSMITLTNAYIADVSSKRWLAVRLGIVEAMFFGGGMISVLIVGEWLRYTNCQYLQGPPILYLACNLIMVMYTLVYLPESLPREERYKRNKRRSAVKQLVRGMKIFTTFRGYSRWRLWFGLIVVGAAYFVTLGSTKINQVYLTASLGWEPDRLGQWTATIQAAHVIVLMILLPILIRLKVPSELLSTTGLLFASVTFIALGILTKTWEAFLGGLILIMYGSTIALSVLDLYMWCTAAVCATVPRMCVSLLPAVGILMGGRGLVGTTTRACLSRVVSPADQGIQCSYCDR